MLLKKLESLDLNSVFNLLLLCVHRCTHQMFQIQRKLLDIQLLLEMRLGEQNKLIDLKVDMYLFPSINQVSPVCFLTNFTCPFVAK